MSEKRAYFNNFIFNENYYMKTWVFPYIFIPLWIQNIFIFRSWKNLGK